MCPPAVSQMHKSIWRKGLRQSGNAAWLGRPVKQPPPCPVRVGRGAQQQRGVSDSLTPGLVDGWSRRRNPWKTCDLGKIGGNLAAAKPWTPTRGEWYNRLWALSEDPIWVAVVERSDPTGRWVSGDSLAIHPGHSNLPPVFRRRLVLSLDCLPSDRKGKPGWFKN